MAASYNDYNDIRCRSKGGKMAARDNFSKEEKLIEKEMKRSMNKVVALFEKELKELLGKFRHNQSEKTEFLPDDAFRYLLCGLQNKLPEDSAYIGVLEKILR